MSQTLTFLITTTAFLKLVAAVDIQQGQITGTLKFLPLPNFQSSLNYPTENLGSKTFERPSSDNCPQIGSLKNILVLLIHLLNQDNNTHYLHPEKKIHILESLKEHLERPESQLNELENGLKLEELIPRTDKEVLVDSNAFPQNLHEINRKSNLEANVILKYDISAINNVDCKVVLAALNKTVNEAYSQMINYYKQLGNCTFNFKQGLLNTLQSDKHNNFPDLGNTVPVETKIRPINPSLANIYDYENSINNFVNTNNQPLNQQILSEYFNPSSFSDIITNQYMKTNSWNSGVTQSQNDQGKNVNLNLNKDASQSNVPYADNSNVLTLNNLHSFYNPLPTQVHVTPAHYNLWNNNYNQNPLKNLIVPQDHVDLNKRFSSVYFNHPVEHPPHTDTNTLISNSVWNTGVTQSNSKQTENYDTNNKYLNILQNDLKNIINAPKIVNSGYNPIPKLQTQDAEGFAPQNDYPNREGYKVFHVGNNNKESMATLNKNNLNNKEQIQFVPEPIPSYGSYVNYPSYLKPNQNSGIVNRNPTFYPSMNTKEIPYLGSINHNPQNILNFNSQNADANIQSNFGINLDAKKTAHHYRKYNIYGNTLFDFERLVSAANSVKLNSAANNNDVVVLTYKLKRPQSLNYNPYYYVKLRMPYDDYVSKIAELSKNPYIRSNPLKIQEELLATSNFEASSDLKNIQRDEVPKLILNNGGTLVNAEVLSTSDSDPKEFLKTIQNLNGNLNTHEILNISENHKSSSHSIPLVSGVPILTPQNNEGLSYQANYQQYMDGGIPRRLFSSVPPSNASSATSFTFLPARVASQLVSNEKPATMSANLTSATW